MKKRILSFLLVIFLGAAQLTAGIGIPAEAALTPSVQVVVEGSNGVLVCDTSSSLNAFDALRDVLSRHGYSVRASDSQAGKFITGIKNLATGKEIKNTADWSSYWLYAVNRGGGYAEADVSISQFELKSGDRLIVYYAGYNTCAANKIEYSTKVPNKSLTIKLNSQSSWDPEAKAISGVDVEIDGISQEIAGNEIRLPDGLPEGRHTLKLSDYRGEGMPNVVGDSFDFYIAYPTASVRVEGLSGTIVEDNVRGDNVMDMVVSVLKAHHIPYRLDSTNSYITSVNGLSAGDLGGWSGWMYYVKSGTIVSPMAGMRDYIPEDGDTVVVYYGDNTPYVTSIRFSPGFVKEAQPFKMQFVYSGFDYASGKYADTPIADAIVSIDGYNYITGADGKIDVKGLPKGEHTYRISGYNIDKLPTVVMDKGTFNIDDINPPGVDYSDKVYDDIYDHDNTKVVKDIDGEIAAVSGYVKSNVPSMWAALSLGKLGLKISTDFFNESAADLKKSGAKSCSNTELEKLILCLTASGYSPYDFAGYDLVDELLSRNIKDFQVNDSAFGLFAMNFANISDRGYRINRKTLADSLIGSAISYRQRGYDITGWTLFGDRVDPDTTGAVINALSPFYHSDKRVAGVVDKAVKSLSALQNESGYIANAYGCYSESLSFAILGLVSVGVNPEGVMFTKPKGDLVSALLSFKGSGGGYRHSLDGKDDSIASEEVLRALIALKQYKTLGKCNFYSSGIDVKKLPGYKYTGKAPGGRGTKTNTGSGKGANAGVNRASGNRGAMSSGGSAATDMGTSDEAEENVPQSYEDKLIREILSAADGSTVTAKAPEDGVIDKSIFAALKGLDRYMRFDIGDVSWTFYGKDIDSADKSIDISLNDVPKYKDEIFAKYNDDGVFIISFRGSGVLPGKAEVKLRLDSGWVGKKDKSSLYLYYFNPENEKAQRIEGPLSLDGEGVITIHLTHCSDYFIADRDHVGAADKKVAARNAWTIGAGVLAVAGACTLLFLARSGRKRTK